MDAHSIVAALDATVLVFLTVSGSLAALVVVRALSAWLAREREALNVWLGARRAAVRTTGGPLPATPTAQQLIHTEIADPASS